MQINIRLTSKNKKQPFRTAWSTAQLALLFFLSAACHSCKQTVADEPAKREKSTIIIMQPLQYDDRQVLNYLRDSVASFYGVTVYLANNTTFPEHTYYKPRNRYRADRVIAWLKGRCPDSVRTIVGITSHDISATRNEQYDYGIMGLGYKPGRSCIVSLYRPAKTAKNDQHLKERLLKLVLHEMGHNFGLSHCPDERCIMVNAEGKMKLDKETGLCHVCRQKLRH